MSAAPISLLWTLVIIIVIIVVIVLLLHLVFAIIAIGPTWFSYSDQHMFITAKTWSLNHLT